jgi:hypothetical protein
LDRKELQEPVKNESAHIHTNYQPNTPAHSPEAKILSFGITVS